MANTEKRCKFYIDDKTCDALTIIDCEHCKFFKEKKGQTVEEEIELYKLKKEQQAHVEKKQKEQTNARRRK